MPVSSELAPLATPPELITQVPGFGTPEQTGLITGVPDFAKSDNPFLTSGGFDIGSFTQGDYQAHKQIEGIKSPWDTAETIDGTVKAPSLAALQVGHTAFNMAVDYIGGEEVISQERVKLGMMKKLGNYVTGKFAQLKLGKDSVQDNSAAEAFAAQTPMPDFKDWSSPLTKMPKYSGWGEAAVAQSANLYDWSQHVQPGSESIPVYHSAINLETANKTVEQFETKNFVKEARRFDELIMDGSRTNPFTYVKASYAKWNQDPQKSEQQVTLTEHEGLIQLATFLEGVAAELPADSRLARRANGIRENLTFIGEQEYQEAAAGLTDLWRAHLKSNPDLQLCIPNKISDQGQKRKSDIHLRESILSNFTDEELATYGPRILTDMDQITQTPDNTKIILLDDWSISGSQARGAYNGMSNDPKFSSYRESLEVNMLVSNAERLEKGFGIAESDNQFNSIVTYIPVKAYFKAHDAAATSDKEHDAHVTGIHSSVDFDFEEVIERMVGALRAKEHASGKNSSTESKIVMPPITNVVRKYRYAKPAIEKTKSGTFKRNKV